MRHNDLPEQADHQADTHYLRILVGKLRHKLGDDATEDLDEAIEAEAVAQALCMQTEDFARAYRAFAAKQKPVFQGD